MLTQATPPGLVFLLDVDNTLLDNDRFSADLDAWLDAHFGSAERHRYRALYEQLRDAHGFADYLGALQRLRSGLEGHPDLPRASAFLLDYPFADLLYPHALDAIAALGRMGSCVILSDGDIVFQPHKIRRAGLWDAVGGRVLVQLHKQHELTAMQARCPARHHVAVDDKPALLAAMKQVMGPRLTTVFVRQGHYAAAAAGEKLAPAPDYTIDRIADLRDLDFSHLIAARGHAEEPT